MKSLLTVSVLAACLATTAVSQTRNNPDCPRDEIKLSASRIPYGNGFDIVCPPNALPANTQTKLVHTAKLAHAFYNDVDSNGNNVLVHRRSLNGGYSWEAPTIIWVEAANEVLRNDYQVAADGHNVFVCLATDRGADGKPASDNFDRCWLVGSNDQGQTWDSIMVSTGIEKPLKKDGSDHKDVDDQQVAASGGRAHCVWEVDYDKTGTNGSSANLENIYYNSVVFNSSNKLTLVNAEEVRIDVGSGNNGVVDADFPTVSAAGTIVCVAWQDHRVVATDTNTFNNVFARVSTTRGATFNAEEQLSAQTATKGTSFSTRRTRSQVEGLNVVVMAEDSRNGTDDDIFFSISKRLGTKGTFTTVTASKSPSGTDSDGAFFALSGGRLALAYNDDRNGAGNVLNNTFVVAGTIDDFLNGKQVETRLTQLDTDLHGIAMKGNNIAVACENSKFPEDFAIAYSNDGGAKWRLCQVIDNSNNNTSRDADAPDVGVTINGDFLGIHIDDNGKGNAQNQCFSNGVRGAQIVDNTNAQNGTMKITGFGPADEGKFAVLVPSRFAPAAPGVNLDPANGVCVNFTRDEIGVNFVLTQLNVYGAPIKNGEAVFTGLNFNLAKLVNLDLWWVGLSVDLSGAQPIFLKGFTDPYKQTK